MSKCEPEALLDFAERIKKTDKNVSSAIIETVFENEIKKLKIRERKDERAKTIEAVLKVVDRKIDELNKQITEIIHEDHIGFKEQKIDWRTRNIELYENLKDELRKEVSKV